MFFVFHLKAFQVIDKRRERETNVHFFFLTFYFDFFNPKKERNKKRKYKTKKIVCKNKMHYEKTYSLCCTFGYAVSIQMLCDVIHVLE